MNIGLTLAWQCIVKKEKHFFGQLCIVQFGVLSKKYKVKGNHVMSLVHFSTFL